LGQPVAVIDLFWRKSNAPELCGVQDVSALVYAIDAQTGSYDLSVLLGEET
jgi:hypothetical protein